MRLFSDVARKRIVSLTMMTLAVSAVSYLTQPTVQAQSNLLNPEARDCAPVLQLSSAPGAMVRLEALLPCDANALVDIEHGPLRFSGLTDADGFYQADLPAITDPVKIRVSSAAGGALASLPMPDIKQFTRVALQWDGDAPFQIHAFELDARPGSPGHIWVGDRKHPLRGVRHKGGFLTELGHRTGRHAQVYSFPSDVGRGGVVRLSVRADVTKSTCGRDLAAETVQEDPFGVAAAMPLTLRMPDCDAIGETLVLKNLLRDLKLAQR